MVGFLFFYLFFFNNLLKQNRKHTHTHAKHTNNEIIQSKNSHFFHIVTFYCLEKNVLIRSYGSYSGIITTRDDAISPKFLFLKVLENFPKAKTLFYSADHLVFEINKEKHAFLAKIIENITCKIVNLETVIFSSFFFL